MPWFPPRTEVRGFSRKLMKFLTEKQKNWSLVVLLLICAVMTGLLFFVYTQLNQERHQLDIYDAELQKLNTELGLAQSSLLTKEELVKKYRDEIEKFPLELQSLIKEYELNLSSRDETIVALKNQIKGGATTVVITEPESPEESPSISYEWRDPSNRFHLLDPDIFIENNEVFTSSQHIIIKGHVFQGKDGRLQTRRIDIQEVIPEGVNEDGSPRYRVLDDVDIAVVDASFEYVDLKEEHKKKLLDVLTFRGLVTFDSDLSPGLGLELVNLGRYVQWANVGLNLGISFDVLDIPGGSLSDSKVTAGAHYHLIPPLLDTNIALGLSIGLPFSNLTSPVLSLTAIFYLTN